MDQEELARLCENTQELYQIYQWKDGRGFIEPPPVLRLWLLDGILQCLACLEHWQLGGGDLHRFVGPGIATGPGVALFHLERAEAHQLYLVPGFHRLGQRVGQSTQRGLAVLLDRPDFSAMADTNSTLSMQKHPLYENYRVIVHLFGLYRKMILHA